MTLNIGQEIERFRGFKSEFEEVISDCLVVRPAQESLEVPDSKQFGLTVLGITHGNEFVGVRVLNELLRGLSSGAIRTRIPLCIGLGNPDAALANRRFVEADLNRSFAREELTAKEHHRAREMESVLDQTYRLVDLHQTREQTEQPFFIFPYSPKGLALARHVSPWTPIVTHWGKPFSKTGRCTDEYTNTRGGAGVTLELGQNGFSDYKIGAGLRAAVNAIQVVEKMCSRSDMSFENPQPTLYTWAEIFDYPSGGEAILKPGFHNFSPVAQGEVLGEIDGKEITAPVSGRLLFPYYPRSKDTKAPAELCRLTKAVDLSQLPG